MTAPSINLIVCGFPTESPIPQLFAAGLVPGMLLAVGFSLLTALICLVRPEQRDESRRSRAFAFWQ